MKKNMLKWAAFLSVATVGWAGEVKAEKNDKDLKKVIEEQGIYVETSQPGIKLSGYVDAGYSYNFTSRNAIQPMRGGNDGANRTENGGDFNLNNFKLVLEKPLSENKEDWSAGFRADLNFGEDALLKAGGNAADGASGLWLQQAYVNFNIPTLDGLQVKAGKWSALTGFEAPERPANINITGGLVAAFEPGEHVGLLGTYAVNKNLTLNFGVANSDWGNNADGVAFAHTGNNGNSSILYTGSAILQNDEKNLTSKFILVYNPTGGQGILQNQQVAGTANQRLNEGESLLFNHNTSWMPKCCDSKLLLGYNNVLGFYDDYANTLLPGNRKYNESYWGLAGYAKYLFTPVFSLAGRVEYVHSTDGAKLGTVGSGLSANSLSGKNSEALGFTLTAGFNLWENMMLRVEYRADATHLNDSSSAAIADGDDSVAQLAAAQVVYSF